MKNKKLEILFLCTGNSCRSQMAEGLANAFKGDEIRAWSAGVESHGLDSHAVSVMKELGIDISGHKSKLVAELPDIKFDYIITVCGHANENCPFFPGPVKRVHAGFDDPPTLTKGIEKETEKLSIYRRVRDEIKDFVQEMPENLK